jgi:hypothetical protein
LKKYSIILINLILALAILTGCYRGSVPEQIYSSVEPYIFSIFRWECQALALELKQAAYNENKADPDDSVTVIKYFELVYEENEILDKIEMINNGLDVGDKDYYLTCLAELSQQRIDVEQKAENILEKQVIQTLYNAGIYNPADSLWNVKAIFPAVKLRLQSPPCLLVVSPRDKIERLYNITLDSYMMPDEIADIEEKIEAAGLSALIVDLGGIATYPSLVSNKYGLDFAINTAIEEWLHQYLAFRPLGALYALNQIGIKQPAEIITMNETLAGMVSRELGQALYQQYYAPYITRTESQDNNTDNTFDFNSEMHRIRVTVDTMLEQGEIKQAEDFMEESRLYLASHGYFIRKLNQAYFAFYGSYADTPGFTDPIYEDLSELRENSASLSEFLNTASSFSNSEQLRELAQTICQK